MEELDKKQALQNAQDAADSRNSLDMARCLLSSTLIEGYAIYFKNRYTSVSIEDVFHVISGVIDDLTAKISQGHKVRSVGGYISKVTDYRLIDYINYKKLHINFNVEDIGKNYEQRNKDTEQAKEDADKKQKKLFETIESLIPRLNVGKVQEVMRYIFGAVKKGLEDIPHQDIANALHLPLNSIAQYKKRGFDRLARIAKEEKLIDETFKFSFFEDDKYFLEGDDESNNDIE